MVRKQYFYYYFTTTNYEVFSKYRFQQHVKDVVLDFDSVICAINYSS